LQTDKPLDLARTFVHGAKDNTNRSRTSEGNQDSGCKLLKNRLRAAWHEQESSKIVL
jgi:hypothetical protein